MADAEHPKELEEQAEVPAGPDVMADMVSGSDAVDNPVDVKQVVSEEVEPVREDSDSGIQDRPVSRPGPVKVPEAVYAELVRRAAATVPGVASVLYRSGPSRMWHRRGIRVRSTWGGRMVVDVSLKLRHGVSIPDTAQQVQDIVREEMEAASGKPVKFVRVRIEEVLPPERRRPS